MTNQTQVVPFQFESHEIRTVVIDNNPYFSARDVALALGYADPSQAYHAHCKALKLLDSVKCTELNWLNHHPRGEYVIAEPDVYRLIVKSTKPQAERFERWVFEEVLPTIRKTGGYQHKAKSVVDPEKRERIMESLELIAITVDQLRPLSLDKAEMIAATCKTINQITGFDLAEVVATPQSHHSPQAHHRTPRPAIQQQQLFADPKQTIINLFVRRGKPLTEREVIQNVKGSNPFKSFTGSQTQFVQETLQELVSNGSLTCNSISKVYTLNQ